MMNYKCFKCNGIVTLSAGSHVGRGDSCESCGVDLHVCKNCRHYDSTAYNQCRESSAERVLEKERSNFCDYFSFMEGDRKSGSFAPGGKASAIAALDALFKK